MFIEISKFVPWLVDFTMSAQVGHVQLWKFQRFLYVGNLEI